MRLTVAVIAASMTGAFVLFLSMLAQVELFGHRSRTDDPLSLAIFALIIWTPLAGLWTGTVTSSLSRKLVSEGKASLLRLTLQSAGAFAGVVLLWVAWQVVDELRRYGNPPWRDLPEEVVGILGFVVSIAAASAGFWLILDPRAYYRDVR
jgi:hypothetical protein